MPGDRDTVRTLKRRFEDAYRLVDQRIEAGQLDPEDARWVLLAQTFRAHHARERWLNAGAPRRRQSDRAS